MSTNYSTPNKPASKKGTISGFYQGVVTSVLATELDPYQIKVDVPSLGHADAGPYPYVGPPPQVADNVWVSFVAGRENDLIIFNAGHQDNDDITEGVYRFGGATEELGVTVHVEPTSHANSNRASLRLDKTQLTGGSGTAGLNGAMAGDFGVYDAQTGGWSLFSSGAYGGFSDTTWNGVSRSSLATTQNTGLTIYAGNKHGTPSGNFYRGFTIRPSYDGNNDGTGSEILYMNWFDATTDGPTDPSSNGNSYYWLNWGQYGYMNGSIHPGSDDTFDLGWSSYRWDDIYATNSSIQTSDVNLKKDIEDTDLGLDFIKSLRPVSYKWRETKGEPGTRKHYGLIGQEVETVLGDKASETAFWTKTTAPAEEELKQTEVTGPDGATYMDGPVRPARDEETRQGLRYGELIAPLIKAIQELEARIAALES
tara:strand:+ start:8365 stop:9636 length:1272 start_codon:yes stop_codon:yes gene_type:complete